MPTLRYRRLLPPLYFLMCCFVFSRSSILHIGLTVSRVNGHMSSTPSKSSITIFLIAKRSIFQESHLVLNLKKVNIFVAEIFWAKFSLQTSLISEGIVFFSCVFWCSFNSLGLLQWRCRQGLWQQTSSWQLVCRGATLKQQHCFLEKRITS